MQQTQLDFLFSVGSPWCSVGQGEAERSQWNPSAFFSRQGFRTCVRRLRGAKMGTLQSLMDEFGAAFQFFDDFGENWYALEECLSYLDEWLEADAYITVIESADLVLDKEAPDQLSALLQTLNAVGRFWSSPVSGNGRFDRPGRPFQTLFLSSEYDEKMDRRFDEAAKAAEVPIRRFENNPY